MPCSRIHACERLISRSRRHDRDPADRGPLGRLRPARRAAHSVSLTVRAGERIGIVGLNGHGKSTLLRAIAGLTDWQSGSIKFNGVEIGGTRSQGPGRYTHKIVRMGLAWCKVTRCSRPDRRRPTSTAAFTTRRSVARAQAAARSCAGNLLAAAEAVEPAGGKALRRRAAHGQPRARADGRCQAAVDR